MEGGFGFDGCYGGNCCYDTVLATTVRYYASVRLLQDGVQELGRADGSLVRRGHDDATPPSAALDVDDAIAISYYTQADRRGTPFPGERSQGLQSGAERGTNTKT